VNQSNTPAPRTELDYLRQMADDIKFIRSFLTIVAIVSIAGVLLQACWLILQM